MQKETYIWGAGHYGVLAALDMENRGVKIKGFIDKDAGKIKTRLNFPVFVPDDILSKKNIFVIIAIQNRTAIEKITGMLLQAGLKKNKNFEISHLVGYKKDLKPVSLAPINTSSLTSYDTDIKKEIKDPIVRVFLITYNHAKFIKMCLNGILMQKTDFPFEIYVYDDCSTDGTSDIIHEYAGKYSNIIADIQSKNYYSNNHKLWINKIISSYKNHNCKYVAVIEGDDYWIDTYKLQLQVNFLEKHNDFTMCSGNFLESNNFNGEQRISLLKIENSVNFEYDFSQFHKNCEAMKTMTSLYRTDAIPEYKIVKKYSFFYDENLVYHILQKGKGYYFSRIFGVYNIHSGGIWSGLNIEQSAEMLYKRHQDIYLQTKDYYYKPIFIGDTLNFIDKCLKIKKQRIDFIKKFINRFPELSKEFKTRLKSID